MSLSLTIKQAQLLAFIEGRIEETGVAPSFEEMKDHLGLAAKSGVHRLICGLEERGSIRRLRNRARAIELVKPRSLAGVPTFELQAELARRGVQA